MKVQVKSVKFTKIVRLKMYFIFELDVQVWQCLAANADEAETKYRDRFFVVGDAPFTVVEQE